MTQRIEISDDFSVSIFSEGDSVPFFKQDAYPNGEPFRSREEAQTWLDTFLLSTSDVRVKTPQNKAEAQTPVYLTRAELLELGVAAEIIPTDWN